MITVPQIKAARKLLGWSQVRLALEAGVAQRTIGDYERGKRNPEGLSASKIKRALEAAGIGFIDEKPGVTLNSNLPGDPLKLKRVMMQMRAERRRDRWRAMTSDRRKGLQ
jgi:transcriptional regulator with XRE-family HTH domain